MTDPETMLAELRALLGARVRCRGLPCEVIEVLEDGPALVLLGCSPTRPIQEDQHGAPGRRAPMAFIVPVFRADRRELHPDFIELTTTPG